MKLLLLLTFASVAMAYTSGSTECFGPGSLAPSFTSTMCTSGTPTTASVTVTNNAGGAAVNTFTPGQSYTVTVTYSNMKGVLVSVYSQGAPVPGLGTSAGLKAISNCVTQSGALVGNTVTIPFNPTAATGTSTITIGAVAVSTRTAGAACAWGSGQAVLTYARPAGTTGADETGDGDAAAGEGGGDGGGGGGEEYFSIAGLVVLYIIGMIVYWIYKIFRHEKGNFQGGFYAAWLECGPDCCMEKEDSFWNKEEYRLGRPKRPLESGDMRPMCCGGPVDRPQKNPKWTVKKNAKVEGKAAPGGASSPPPAAGSPAPAPAQVAT